MYVVELQAGCWLSNWKGDPGRTLVLDSAKKFNFKLKAEKALEKAKKDNPFRAFTTAQVVLLK